MNLPIIQSIIHGELRPNLFFDKEFFRITINAFNKLPAKLSEIERLFISQIPSIPFDFESEHPFPIDEIMQDDYTPINEDLLSKHFVLPTPTTTTYKERFYKIIAEAEFYRVKIAVIDYARKQHSDTDTRRVVIDTLNQIFTYSKSIDSVSDTILAPLKIRLVCFYVELVSLTSTLLTENDDYYSFDDLVNEMFDRYPNDEEISTYNNYIESLNKKESVFVNTTNDLPSPKEYERKIFETNYEVFVKEVSQYRFADLEKVCSLSKGQQSKLIHLITSNDTNYAVPMLIHIGYYDKLRKEYNMSNSQIFKHWSKALTKSERSIKGNFNALKPESKEDKYRYNSADFVEKVTADYNNL